MSLLDALQWRAAVRKYDQTKKVSNEDLEKLLEAGNLTATSMGLQPFKIVVVNDKALQEQLVPASYNQQHVAEASHILVFAVHTNIDQASIDALIERIMEVRGVSREDLEGYHKSMSGYLSTMDDGAKLTWATKQAYIALGTVMSMAADLKIDSCAMEGFDPLQYQEMLGLKEENLMPVVVLPIGYRSAEDVMASLPKVRKKREDFVLELK